MYLGSRPDRGDPVMPLSRRQVIEAGAVAGALVAMPSRLLASVVDPITPVRSVPAQPRIAVDPVIDRGLVARARAAFDRHRGSLAAIDVVGIVDFGKASADPRFFLLDTNSGRVTRHLVAHGRGSDPAHTGFLQRFSNQPGSEASSNGAYVTGAFYPGHSGRAMRLRGLDDSNSNAEARAVVVHSAWYAEPNVLAASGRLGRSEGCFALPYAGLQEVMQRL